LGGKTHTVIVREEGFEWRGKRRGATLH